MVDNTDLGIVALGGALSHDTLITAYENGIFPWPMEDMPLPWVCPPMRAILEFQALHIPRSLAKAIRHSHYSVTLNQAFTEVIRHCQATPRPGQPGTWITPRMKEAYIELHKSGFAHSVEVWDEQKNLVGGLYGVSVKGTFAGESMFHFQPNTSKMAIIALIGHLKTYGLMWMDIQMLTPHMELLGAREISREEFLQLLFRTQEENHVIEWKPRSLGLL